MRVVLASKSPRRRDLLREVFPEFEIIVADVDETLPCGSDPREGVEVIAKRKGSAVVDTLPSDTLVVSSDTLVELDGVALGKPSDREDAIRMLRALSGRAHNVHTGVAVHYKGRTFSGTDSTVVYFRELSDADILEYVNSGEPMDKAGAYGIQGGAGRFVLRYDGDFDTVVGLSLRLTRELVRRATGTGKKLSKAEKKERMSDIVERLKALYPEAECALLYEGDPWRLLVMARLSAQCTDARVNITSRELFKRFPTPLDMAEGDLCEIEEIIKPCGLYRMKAKNIKEASRAIMDVYGGALPRTMDELLLLPGVGRKIANLLLGDIYGLPAIVCDTHCMRICGRLGMYPESLRDPVKIERILKELILPEECSDFCHRIVLFGREICTARSPKCAECPLSSLCLRREREVAK